MRKTQEASVSIRQLNKVEADVQTHIQEVWLKICSIMEAFFHKYIDTYEVSIRLNKSDLFPAVYNVAYITRYWSLQLVYFSVMTGRNSLCVDSFSQFHMKIARKSFHKPAHCFFLETWQLKFNLVVEKWPED